MNISAKFFNRFFIEASTFSILTKNNFCAFTSLKLFSPLSVSLVKFNASILYRSYMDLASVIKVIEELIPPNLAEKWDNTGLLVEPSDKASISTIFLTNDLTEDVVKEAISHKSNLLISYHPPIFSPLKSLKQLNWKDRIIIKCIENSIAVYSPHTGCDAVDGGVNDWLINCFGLSGVSPIIPSCETRPEYTHVMEFTVNKSMYQSENFMSVPSSKVIQFRQCPDSSTDEFMIKVNETSLKHIIELLTDKDSKSSICVTPLKPLPLLSCGMGRIGKLSQPLSLEKCIKLVKSYLSLDHIRFAQSVSHSLDTPISIVAVCAGSGSSVLKGVNADLYITGEMSHHDLLDAIHRNVSVILCEHSNSERGYLNQLVKLLSPKLTEIKLIVSSTDKDPISIM